ncbi:MAG: tetratricopeptide repeat protein [Deltaproteobacteria bacterium]|nr:MAG: tetratricopeptide repeat protein [Deltaproteobacteria bacterium]
MWHRSTARLPNRRVVLGTLIRLRFCLAAGLCLPAGLASAGAAKQEAAALWRGPAGVMRIHEERGGRLVGTLVEAAPGCSLQPGARVLEGVLQGGNFTGKVRVCLEGCSAQGEAPFAFAMLVKRKDRLSGAAHARAPAGCRVAGLSAKGGLVVERMRQGGDSRGHRGETYDPRHYGDARVQAMEIARVGAAYLAKGRFQKARQKFQEAVTKDPSYAEGYNGIGVTYAAENDFKEALQWYQRSIAANPEIGDAYYNLACAYARTGDPKMAVNYLRIAVLNGYAQPEQIAADPDLETLHDRADFQAVLRLAKTSEASSDSGPRP